MIEYFSNSTLSLTFIFALHSSPNIKQPLSGASFDYRQLWSTGLFECCADLKILLFAVACAPCFLVSVYTRAGECMFTPFCCPLFSLVQLRSKMRAQYQIGGALWKDAFEVHL